MVVQYLPNDIRVCSTVHILFDIRTMIIDYINCTVKVLLSMFLTTLIYVKKRRFSVVNIFFRLSS